MVYDLNIKSAEPISASIYSTRNIIIWNVWIAGGKDTISHSTMWNKDKSLLNELPKWTRFNNEPNESSSDFATQFNRLHLFAWLSMESSMKVDARTLIQWLSPNVWQLKE